MWELEIATVYVDTSIGVITGCRRGYSINYVVLIMSRAMLQAALRQSVIPTNIEKQSRI